MTGRSIVSDDFSLKRVFLRYLASRTIGHIPECSSKGGEAGETDDLSYIADFRCCRFEYDHRW